jgi:two-component system response regulator NreC
MVKLAICDDHPLFNDGLLKIVQEITNCEVISRAFQGAELIEKIRNKKVPDVVLLDIHMPPGINGYHVVKYCKEHFPSIKFIALTFFSDSEAILGMIKVGASGFISKGASKEILAKAINEVSKGNFFLDPNIDKSLLPATLPSDSHKHGIESLTLRELEVAKLMCTDKPYKQIALELKISVNTVENIRIRIFKKIGAKTRTEAALFFSKTGLLG